ncbi:hypothetical protein CYMTET_35537 [Cymbomonas tetramitiformis]|uniref:Uncharacterized protein n=1 Tax=Cymbomonas tetramitiformis TaxID=36881 RepID=A0AAE0KNT8_9CHLO|nr:hypothetical protein CYMTET_35537 [Cymbomonas tetramitiformis]
MTLQSFMSAPNYNGSRVAAAAIRQLQDQLAACEAQLAHATSQNMVLQEECYRLSLVPAREEQETNNRFDHELREDMTQMSSNISEVKKALQDTVQQAAAAENKAQDLQTESQRLKEENRSLMLQLRRCVLTHGTVGSPSVLACPRQCFRLPTERTLLPRHSWRSEIASQGEEDNNEVACSGIQM